MASRSAWRGEVWGMPQKSDLKEGLILHQLRSNSFSPYLKEGGCSIFTTLTSLRMPVFWGQQQGICCQSAGLFEEEKK